jgi:hypothetical protein
MSNTNQGVSKEEVVEKDMAGALAGRTEGVVSNNYQGMPRNTDPQHPHKSRNSQPVAD